MYTLAQLSIFFDKVNMPDNHKKSFVDKLWLACTWFPLPHLQTKPSDWLWNVPLWVPAWLHLHHHSTTEKKVGHKHIWFCFKLHFPVDRNKGNISFCYLQIVHYRNRSDRRSNWTISLVKAVFWFIWKKDKRDGNTVLRQRNFSIIFNALNSLP